MLCLWLAWHRVLDDLSRVELVTLVRELQSQLAERDAVIAVQQETLAAQREALESLASEVKLLKRALFGNRRERFVDDPNQRTLFDSQWIGPAGNEAAAEDQDEAPSTKRRRGQRGRIVIPAALPRKKVVHPLQEEDLPEHLRGRDDHPDACGIPAAADPGLLRRPRPSGQLISPYFLEQMIGDLSYSINKRTSGPLQDQLAELCARLEYIERTGDGTLDLL